MEPDKSELKLLPKPAVNAEARRATNSSVLGGALTVAGFLVLWGPYYLIRSEGQLFFYPFVFASIPLIWILALRAIVFGRRGLRWAAGADGLGQRSSVWSLIGGIALLILPYPVFQFGGWPLTLFTG